MESSTIIFIITLITLFIFLRWLIAPIPQTIPHEVEALAAENHSSLNGASLNNASGTATRRHNGGNRAINQSMIEVVQAIGPQLTESQIRYDLSRSGSVEATVNNYMENGTLPFPPGESAPVVPNHVSNSEENHNIPPSTVSLNLLEKYGLDENDDIEDDKEISQWGSSKEERMSNLERKRKQMILNARKRLASQLSNEKPNVL